MEPSPPRTVQEIMQRMCDLFGHPEAIVWDRYGPQNRGELVRKLQIVFSPNVPDSSTLSVDEEMIPLDGIRSAPKPVTPAVESLASAIWDQRKYCHGTLLMTPIFIACVPNDDFGAMGTRSVQYSIHPLFRVAKCFDDFGQTVNCCNVFLDETGRVYSKWVDFVANNQFGSSVVVVAPTDGIFHQDSRGIVRLSVHREHHRVSIAMPASVLGLVASGIYSVALFTPLMPVALVTGALVAGVASASVSIGSGIGRLIDRSHHEQSIGMEDKESRGVWLGLGGAAVTVSAGAAMHGVKLAAESGAVLSRTASIAVTGLGAAAIASNGVVVANGFYGFFTSEHPSLLEVLQLSGSMFLLTHSVANFQTARSLYVASQKTTLQSFMSVLSENQQQIFGKMLNQTVRNNDTSKYADVIRSLRSIDIGAGSFENIISTHRVTSNPTTLAVTNSTIASDTTRCTELAAIAASMKTELQTIVGRMSPLAAVQFVWRFYQQNDQLINEQLRIHFDGRFIGDVCRIVRFLAKQSGKIVLEYLQFIGEQAIYGKLAVLYENRFLQMIARLAVGSLEGLFDGCVEVLNTFVRYIQDMNGFRETILALLEELSHRVVKRLLMLSKCSFGALLEMGFQSMLSFDGFFGDLLEVVLQMARENGFHDLSMFVLCMDQVDMEKVHERITKQFEWMKNHSKRAIKCKSCIGHYNISSV